MGLTCRHVAAELAAADQLLAKYNDFKTKRLALRGHKNAKQLLKNLEVSAGILPGNTIELHWMVMDCIEGMLNANVYTHDTLDIALIHFTGYQRLLCDSFPVFAAQDNDLKQGKFLCRLGYPFPEFTNFAYDPSAERIVWTKSGRIGTPRFPIEGMLTRHLLDTAGAVIGFEISGGPAFDVEGRVWGMQSATNALDLNFDVNTEVSRGAAKIRVKEHALLHVGHCVHVGALKDFMQQHNVTFASG